MSVDGAPDPWESLPHRTCRACEADVPMGAYCGNCGATPSADAGGGRAGWRLSAHAAVSDESVLRPVLTSTIFPQLPKRSLSVFRVALFGFVVLLLVAAALRWQAPLIGLVTVGMPVLFAAYLKETDAFDDMSRGTLFIAATLGAALGIGWALGTDAAIARTEDDALGIPVTAVRLLITGLAIPLGFVVLLLAPVVAMRRWRPGVRESLNGFAIGSLVAYCFTAAGTVTRLAPQFTSGPVADEDRSAVGLGVAAVIQGFALPLTAAAVAGALGATLWCVRRADSGRTLRWYSPSSPTPSVAVGVVLFLGLGVIDLGAPSRYLQLGLYGLIAVLALVALRIAVHSTVLVEHPDDASPREPVLCPQCEHVVPELPFCPNCGVAGHAASRTSRAARRNARPVAAGPALEVP
jgi:hypothetical protein